MKWREAVFSLSIHIFLRWCFYQLVKRMELLAFDVHEHTKSLDCHMWANSTVSFEIRSKASCTLHNSRYRRRLIVNGRSCPLLPRANQMLRPATHWMLNLSLDQSCHSQYIASSRPRENLEHDRQMSMVTHMLRWRGWTNEKRETHVSLFKQKYKSGMWQEIKLVSTFNLRM